MSTTTLTRERLATSSGRDIGVAAVEYTQSGGAACSARTTASTCAGSVSGSSPWTLMHTSYAAAPPSAASAAAQRSVPLRHSAGVCAQARAVSCARGTGCSGASRDMRCRKRRRTMTTSAPKATHATRMRSSSVATTGVGGSSAGRAARQLPVYSTASGSGCYTLRTTRPGDAPTLLSDVACRACSHVCCAAAGEARSSASASASDMRDDVA